MKLFWILCFLIGFVSADDDDDRLKWQLDYMAEHGSCAYFYKNPLLVTPWSGLCERYCNNQPNRTSWQCDYMEYTDIDIEKVFDKSWISYYKGEPWVSASCKCNDAAAEYLVGALIDGILDMLRQLAELICGVIQEIMPVIKGTLKALDIATDVVPLPQARMAKLLIQGAKTFYENGLGQDEFLDSWVKKECGKVDHPGDVFSNLINAPDSHGTSQGCLPKNKGRCRKLDPKPDPPKKDDKGSSGGNQGKGGNDDKGSKPTTKAQDDKTSSRPAPATTSKPISSSASKTSSSSRESKSSTSALSSKTSAKPTSSTPSSQSLPASASKTSSSPQESKSSTSVASSKASSNPTSSTPSSNSLPASASKTSSSPQESKSPTSVVPSTSLSASTSKASSSAQTSTQSSSAVSSRTSSSSSSSASPSSTKYICGQSCGKKGCAVNPSKASSGKQPKVTKRSEYFKRLVEKRTLGTVPDGKADDYVLEAINRASKVKDSELDYAFNNHYAVSKHGEFLDKSLQVFLTGLEGCTGIAVISEKGYWISHFMEIAFGPTEKARWDNLWAATTKGNSKYTRPDTLADIFGPGSNPRIYLMRPLDADTAKVLYDTQIDKIMGEVQSGILQTATTYTLKYKKPKNIQELDTVFETTARGKMLIEYSNNHQVKSASSSSQAGSTTAAPSQATATPQQSAAARIFMETQADERSWAASEVQRNGKKDDANSDKPVPEHRATCLKDGSSTVSLADVDAAFMNAFKTAIDVKNPVSQTGTSGATTIQFSFRKSASQAGCNKSEQTKMMKMSVRKLVGDATKQCPQGSDGTAFMGVKPDIVNTGIGCIDFEVFKV